MENDKNQKSIYSFYKKFDIDQLNGSEEKSENMIINKWIVKTLNIEELMEDFSDWNKIDIETDWENEINNYENDINDKIQLYNKSLANAKILLEEIKNETNFNIWDKKILKLKKQIIKI